MLVYVFVFWQCHELCLTLCYVVVNQFKFELKNSNNISIFTDLTIWTLLIEPQNVKTMVIPHVQGGIKLCFSWQWGEN